MEADRWRGGNRGQRRRRGRFRLNYGKQVFPLRLTAFVTEQGVGGKYSATSTTVRHGSYTQL